MVSKGPQRAARTVPEQGFRGIGAGQRNARRALSRRRHGFESRWGCSLSALLSAGSCRPVERARPLTTAPLLGTPTCAGTPLQATSGAQRDLGDGAGMQAPEWPVAGQGAGQRQARLARQLRPEGRRQCRPGRLARRSGRQHRVDPREGRVAWPCPWPWPWPSRDADGVGKRRCGPVCARHQSPVLARGSCHPRDRCSYVSRPIWKISL